MSDSGPSTWIIHHDDFFQKPSGALQPSICSLDDNAMHIIMGHLVGEARADIIQSLWDANPFARHEVDQVCIEAEIPAELCRI